MVASESRAKVAAFMERIKGKNPNEPEFHQAVLEVALDIIPFIEQNPKYAKAKIFERLTEPDRVIQFRVCYEDDRGEMQVQKGYRVQFNNAIGPYKGGLRFHPSVSLSILKFLGFEQILKNSLTTLPIGGGKGGSDFDPKGKSDAEVMRFCHAFMWELSRHIGPDTDIPAGDIGVGARELGFMYGAYKKFANTFTGTFTGKGLSYGGSLIRPEATGYGCVYFVEEMLKNINENIAGRQCLVSGSGNVAQFAAEKIIQLGGKVLTVSDSSGTVYDKAGLNTEKLEFVKHLKNVTRGRIEEFAKKFNLEFLPNKKPWHIPADAAFPCATQNEILKEDALLLAQNHCKVIAEGANMPTHMDAIEVLAAKDILYAPGKASNAGGVAVSALEMAQNSMRLHWSKEEVDQKLKQIMQSIHQQCHTHGKEGKKINYVKGANVAGFLKVADAMLAYGTM